MKVKACPVCGESGSLVTKWVFNNQKTKYTYYYVAHHHTDGITWCYIGKTGMKKENDEESNEDKESNVLVPED